MSNNVTFLKGNPRACALECLHDWENSTTYAHEIFGYQADRYELKPVDRGLAKELLFGTLRHLSFLDKIIDELRKKGSLKMSARCLLRLGVYQIFQTKIADHAAVHETVNLARKHERPLVNAILRNAIRQQENFVGKSKNWTPAERYSHPAFLIERWTAEFGEDTAAALCEWNNTPPPVYARIHDEEGYHERLNRVQSETVQGTVGDSTGYSPEPVAGFPEFIKLPSGPLPTEWIESGTIYIQDPSTSLACWLLAPQPDELILDACAAPGGKTIQLASMAPAGTKIIATDSNPKRIERMEENFSRMQIEGVTTREVDWTRPSQKQLTELPRFDAILLDVPCSNTGVMRRRVDVRWRLRPSDFAELAALQLKILKNTMRVLKPDGRIVYSTCSIDPEENRKLVESCGLKIVEIRETVPWKDGVDGAFTVLLRPH